MLSPTPAPPPTSVSTRFFDFWLLGGASILLFILMAMANSFRENTPLIQQKFLLVVPVFSLFSIFCNDPHFIISYRFGYSRGLKFILKYWFSLIILPLLLIALYTTAYFQFDTDVSEFSAIKSINYFFEFINLTYRFGKTATFGRELMSLSIWFMYLTVGWHYSKQIYGCLMVYDKFDNYKLGRIEKEIFRYSLLFLALYQFLFISRLMDLAPNNNYQDPRFGGIQILALGLPNWLFTISQLLAVLSFLSVLIVIAKKYLLYKKIPSAIFTVAWLSIYFWWIQIFNLPEYYYMAVPFFHSLQYLPFAFKMEKKNIPANRWRLTQISLRLIALIIVGFLYFELIPTTLDQKLNTEVTKTAWIFMTSFAVFINIHHFFIDSVVWRLKSPEVKSGLL